MRFNRNISLKDFSFIIERKVTQMHFHEVTGKEYEKFFSCGHVIDKFIYKKLFFYIAFRLKTLFCEGL